MLIAGCCGTTYNGMDSSNFLVVLFQIMLKKASLEWVVELIL
jgi:hypothetical protein